ncbi:MAG: hypothetical protein R2856_08810 [Caldilineaceae bacterium]
MIQDVIMHRLAQLSTNARRIVDGAAVVGREFSLDVLQGALAIDEERW